MRIFLDKKRTSAVLVFLLVFSFLLSNETSAIFGIPEPVYLLDPPTTGLLTNIAASTDISAGLQGTANTLLGSILASGIATNVSLGVPIAAGTALSSLDSVCSGISGIQNAETIAATADNFSDFSLIGGSPAEAAKLKAKIVALTVVKTCRDKQLLVVSNLPVANMIMGQELIRKQASLRAEVESLNTRIDNLTERQNASIKDVLRAISIKILLNLSQKMTTDLVNKMVAKYKIGNFLQYANAVTNQVYTIDYIRNNYTDKQDQMILRSILQDNTVSGTVMPLVRMKANQALGFAPEQLSFADPNYYVKLAQAGKSQSNPFFMQILMQSNAEQAKAAGNAMAQQEIAQGKGFIAQRNCDGSVAQQQSLDNQRKTLQTEAGANSQIYNRLLDSSLSNPGSVSQSDLDKAAQASKDSDAKLKALASDGNPVFLDLCKGITNPAGFMADGIQNFLNKHLNEAANLKTENLPFWGTFIANVASNFISNILEGGRSNTQLLTEAGIASANLAAGGILNQASQSGQSLAKGDNQTGVTFDTPQAVSGQRNTYTLSWKVDTSTVSGASYVTIRGIGIGETIPDSNGNPVPNKLPLSGSVTIQNGLTSTSPDTDRDYYLKVYDTSGKQIGSPVSTSIPNSGQVSGAFVARPSESIRNWQAISPRAAN